MCHDEIFISWWSTIVDALSKCNMLYKIQKEIYAVFQRYVKQVSFDSLKLIVLCSQTVIFPSLVKN